MSGPGLPMGEAGDSIDIAGSFTDTRVELAGLHKCTFGGGATLLADTKINNVARPRRVSGIVKRES